jgi:hypothetical protein
MLGSGDQHAVAQVAPAQRRTLRTNEQQLRLAPSAAERLRLSGELLADWAGPPAVAGLRRGELAADDRAAHVDPRRRPLQVNVHDAEADRLGDPQTRHGEQLEERPPLHRDLGQQRSKLFAGEEAAFVEFIGAAAPAAWQQHQGRRVVGDQTGAGGVAQVGLQGQDCVADPAVRQAMSVSVGLPA